MFVQDECTSFFLHKFFQSGDKYLFLTVSIHKFWNFRTVCFNAMRKLRFRGETIKLSCKPVANLLTGPSRKYKIINQWPRHDSGLMGSKLYCSNGSRKFEKVDKILGTIHNWRCPNFLNFWPLYSRPPC